MKIQVWKERHTNLNKFYLNLQEIHTYDPQFIIMIRKKNRIDTQLRMIIYIRNWIKKWIDK